MFFDVFKAEYDLNLQQPRKSTLDAESNRQMFHSNHPKNEWLCARSMRVHGMYMVVFRQELHTSV